MHGADWITIDWKYLRQVSKDITLQESRDMKLWSRLKKMNKTAWTEGCGLAAVQIGIAVRFGWFVYEKREFTLLNPRIIEYSEPFIHEHEGCLSIPHKWIDVERFNRIIYVTHGKEKKASGRKAVIIQHEVDHMDGILNIDRKA
jgi:peptide deformylase